MKKAVWISCLWLGTACSTTPLSGAGATAVYKKEQLLAPNDKARIVFLQNRREDRGMAFTVFESDRRCVAVVGGREAQVLDVFPGPYIFFISAYEQNRRIEIYPEAGRTYFVRLHSVEKAVGAAAEITVVRRASEEHRLLRYHLEGAILTYATDNKACYALPLDERERRTNRRLNDANAEWNNGDDVYRFRYTLIERDGLTREDIGLF
jgi:hypothetical protein